MHTQRGPETFLVPPRARRRFIVPARCGFSEPQTPSGPKKWSVKAPLWLSWASVRTYPLIIVTWRLAQQSLPPSALARAILFIVGAVLLIILGLVVLTLMRWLVRRRLARLSDQHPSSPRSGRGVRELSPWETAGRRVSPDDFDEDQGAQRGEGLQ